MFPVDWFIGFLDGMHKCIPCNCLRWYAIPSPRGKAFFVLERVLFAYSMVGGIRMIMSYIFTGCLILSVFSAVLTGNGSALGSAVFQGAQSGITLAISIAGALCLWSGVGHVMEKTGISKGLSKLLSPLLHFIFPSARTDTALGGSLSANICANFLGLGNAATPMGIAAAERLAKNQNGIVSDELCRLIVLNTASIQFIPSTVGALRASLGCATPFDILLAVWITSLCSAGLGLAAAFLLGKVWRK